MILPSHSRIILWEHYLSSSHTTFLLSPELSCSFQRPRKTSINMCWLNEQLMILEVRRVESKSGSEIQEKQNQKDKIKDVGCPFSTWGPRLDMDAWKRAQSGGYGENRAGRIQILSQTHLILLSLGTSMMLKEHMSAPQLTHLLQRQQSHMESVCSCVPPSPKLITIPRGPPASD